MYCCGFHPLPEQSAKKSIISHHLDGAAQILLSWKSEAQACSFEKVISVKCCSYGLSPLCPYITSKCHLQHRQQAWRPVTNSILMMFTLHCLDDVFNPTDSRQNGISDRCNTDCEMNHGIIGTINHVLSFRFKIQLRRHGSTHYVSPQSLPADPWCLHRVLHYVYIACVHIRMWRPRAGRRKPERSYVSQGDDYCNSAGNYSLSCYSTWGHSLGTHQSLCCW